MTTTRDLLACINVTIISSNVLDVVSLGIFNDLAMQIPKMKMSYCFFSLTMSNLFRFLCKEGIHFLIFSFYITLIF